jgi:hypothetical protein
MDFQRGTARITCACMERRRGAVMQWKRISTLLWAALIVGLAEHGITVAAPKLQFNIVYTNDMMGEVEPCG